MVTQRAKLRSNTYTLITAHIIREAETNIGCVKEEDFRKRDDFQMYDVL